MKLRVHSNGSSHPRTRYSILDTGYSIRPPTPPPISDLLSASGRRVAPSPAGGSWPPPSDEA